MTQIGTEVQVRPGTKGDLGALTEIYNHDVRETALTFDTAPFTPGQRLPWLRSHPVDGPHRLLVAQDVRNVDAPGAGGPAPRILGYATSSAFRPKAASSTSAEVSVYCAPGAAGRGIGTLLYTALFEALADEDLHRAYAGIAQPNEASVRLHGRFGFRHLGTYAEAGRKFTYAEAGRKFGRYWDVARYGKHLGPSA
ncbi:GNAT family N-acetyltransferase [Streptomyces sp. NPDC088726]|uniref:GNAT family N-acetyltransferase n=1 Tax=Streptomyces sp. NPDC088726 TaxID=3365874 RepID=UPI0038252C6C